MNAEPAPQFVDTNLLIYAYDISSGSRHAVSKALVDRLWATQSGCVSTQVLQEFYVVGMRKLPEARASEMRTRVESLGEWSVHQPSVADLLAAIDLHRQYQFSFWDAMILNSAHALGCSILWSEDLSHGQTYGGVTVQNPFINSRI